GVGILDDLAHVFGTRDPEAEGNGQIGHGADPFDERARRTGDRVTYARDAQPGNRVEKAPPARGRDCQPRLSRRGTDEEDWIDRMLLERLPRLVELFNRDVEQQDSIDADGPGPIGEG